MSVVFDTVFDEDNQPALRGTDTPAAPVAGPITALYYAEQAPSSPANSPFGSLDRVRDARTAELNRWRVWGAVYGGQSNTTGDLSQGTHDRSVGAAGFASGADYQLTADTRIGFALSGGGTRFGLADSFGSGSSDMMQAALYAHTNFGSAYVTSAIAYAWNNVSTSRTVTIGGSDTFTAAFSANTVAGRVEAGYRFGWLAPYASVGVQAFYAPSYNENVASGLPTFALAYDARTTITTDSQLGVRMEQSIALPDSMTLILRSRAAWVHDFSPAPSIEASFQALPGSYFTVDGALQASDSLLLSLSAEVKLGHGFSVAALLDSQIARGSQSYSGRGQVRYTW